MAGGQGGERAGRGVRRRRGRGRHGHGHALVITLIAVVLYGNTVRAHDRYRDATCTCTCKQSCIGAHAPTYVRGYTVAVTASKWLVLLNRITTKGVPSNLSSH